MKKTRLIFIVATISVIAVIAAALVFFGGALSSHKQEEIEKRLQDSVEPNTVSFALQIEEQVKKVKTFAAFLGENWDLDQEVMTSLLRAAVEHNGLLRCAIAFPDGSFITHDSKNEGNVTEDAFFKANMRGEFFITDPRPAVVDPTKTVILFSAPIFDADEQILGSVIYSYLCDDLDQIFNLESMDGALNLVVVKQSGQLLIGDSPYAESQANLIENLIDQCTHQGHGQENCLKITGERGTQTVSHRQMREPLYVHYRKLAQNDWYMLASIPESAASASVSYAAQNQRQLSGLIACGVAAYVVVLLVLWILQRKLVDVETGAPTLYAFKKKCKRIFDARKSEQFVVVMIDIKDFKLINRIYSFAMGDKVIKSVAQALKTVLSDPECALARVGVDSFVLLLPYEGRDALDEKRRQFIETFHDTMQENFCTKIVFPTGQYVLKPSDFPRPDINSIFEKVNFAHRAAKSHSDLIIDYEEDVENAALFEKTVEDRMEEAIASREFTLYLQPKIRLSDEGICGAEALVRWKIGEKYYMYPTDFIPVLEKNGFIVQLDFYMFQRAASFIRDCMDKGVTPVPIAVNFSRHHLNNKRFVEELCNIADDYAVPHQYLEIEITESAFLGHIADMKKLIDTAHAAGFLLSMDDFGSGYSCFAQLKDLEIDVLKIDKGFFTMDADQQRVRTVVAGIIKIAQELQITTVAEGIEEASQVAMLKELGCDVIQGYFYAKPIPASQLDLQNFTVTPMEAPTQIG